VAVWSQLNATFWSPDLHTRAAAHLTVGGDYAPALGVWHNVTATTRAAGPSLTRGAG
jgi:hypothetical protein